MMSYPEEISIRLKTKTFIDLQDEKLTSGLLIEELDISSGFYFCQSWGLLDRYSKKLSVYQILKSRIIFVEGNNLSFPYLEKDLNLSSFLPSYFNISFKLFTNKLKTSNNDLEILVNKDSNYDEIDRLYSIHNSSDFISLLINKNESPYLKLLKSKPLTLLRQLYIGIIYYLIQDIQKSKSYIEDALRLSEKSGEKIKEYLTQIRNLISDSTTKSQFYEVLLVHETVSKVNTSHINSFKNIFSLINDSKGVGDLKNVFGSEKNILDQIENVRPTILIFWGHGSFFSGYTVESNTGIGKGSITYDELSKVLTDNTICIIDTTCSNNHFKLLKDELKMTELNIIGNEKLVNPSFTTNSAYYYLMGFLSRFYSREFNKNHKLGLLTMSMYSKDFLGTFEIR